MDGYKMIMLLQEKMKDPQFSQRFNLLAGDLNTIPGLQSKIMEIMQIENDKKREKALEKLPTKAKAIVKELLMMINQ